MKKIVAVLLSLALLLGNAPLIQAEELPEQAITRAMPTGLMPSEGHRVTATEIAKAGIFSEEQLRDGSLKKSRSFYSAQYNHQWDAYSTDYYYNQLNSQEKTFWDDLDLICLYYLTTTETAGDMTEYIRAEGLSEQQMLDVAYLFRLSNPQYYFIDNSYSWGKESASGIWCYSFGVYDDFEDGISRQGATQNMQTRISTWMLQIIACGTQSAKVKKIHDLICDKVEYDMGIYGTSTEDEARAFEQSHYTQSAYSTLCMEQTVCAGYSQAFSLLSNGAGIDAISVTSDDHQWNKVNVNNSWYNIDLTWDDQDGGIIYKYFLRSDSFWDSEHNSSHTEEEKFDDIIPNCVADVGGGSAFTSSRTRMEKPTISCSPCIDYYIVTMSNIPQGATIYYTVDNQETDAASVQLCRYGGQFKVNCGDSIRAIAVKENYIDSDILGYNVPSSSATSSVKSVANTTSGVKIAWSGVSGATGYRVYRKTGSGSWSAIGTTTGTSYTDKKVSSGKTYSYTIQPYTNSYAGKYGSQSLSIKYLSYGNVKSLTNVEKGIQVKWAKVSGASGYEIWRKQGSGSYSKIATIKKGSTVSYTDTKVKSKAGKTYTYKVVPYSGSTKASYNTKALIRLTTPTLSSAKNTAKSTVTLKWKKASGAKGYYVYRKTGNGDWKKIATVKGASKVTYKDKKAKKGKTYTYSIKSYNGKSTSSYAKKSIKVKAKK